MEVTHREDKITHAVIGGGETISMGITDDAMFMHMLSSTLYSDKILAVVRESLCNAWDAHIEAKRVDRPIEIMLTRDKFTLKDHGLGIHHDQIGPIYGTYGASTKKHDGNQTGGFGLGCKSPFAYVDHFEVTSCHQGVKTVYRMTKSAAERGGKPGIIPLLSVPTDEEGLTMSFAIKDVNDYQRFEKLVRRIAANGEINATLNGNAMPIIEFSQMQHGYVITKETVLENFSRVCLRYGNVIYPLESHQEYAHEYGRVVAVLEMLGSHYGNYALILQAKPNTLSITPSRESLSMEDKTTKTVSTMLKKFLHAHHNRFDRECLELVKSTNEDFVRKGKAHQLLRSPTAKNLCEAVHVRRDTKMLITDTTQAAYGYLSHTYPDNQRFAFKDMLHRLTAMIKHGSYDKGLLQTFRREYRRAPHGELSRKDQWFQRHLVAPLVSGMKGTGLQDTRLMTFFGRNTHQGWGYSPETYTHSYCPRTMHDMLPFLRKILVLTHSQKKIEERVGRVPNWFTKYGVKSGFMVYIVPRSPKKVEEARAFFEQQNVVLIDLTLHIEKRESIPREKAIKKSIVPGYPTLFSSRVGDKYVQDEAKNGFGLVNRVEKPLFYTYLNKASDRYTTQRDIPDLDSKASKAVFDLWGKQGAVIFTQLVQNKMTNDGVPSLMSFLVSQMTKLMKDKAVIKYMSSSAARMAKHLTTSSAAVEQMVTLINDHPALYEALKLGVPLPPEKLAMLRIWTSVEDRRSMVEVKRLVKDISLNKKSEAVIEKLEASKQLPYMDMSVLDECLKSKNKTVIDRTIKFILKTIKE